MLLWHSTGSGKTCSAIAAASNEFEKEGYTILWVTRTTLKNDIWKNMFDQVCHEVIRTKLSSGEIAIPSEQPKRMKLLSPSWRIRPMSYKQFSNLVSKQNQLYDTLVKVNGAADPLRKTLLIIDEAHKLYGGGDLSTIERPDMKALRHHY
jgi:superfamily II DNA or RNA helicase